MSNAKAQAKYHERRSEIEHKLNAITEMVKNHRDGAGDELNWAHVGDLAQVADQLDEIIRFLGN